MPFNRVRRRSPKSERKLKTSQFGPPPISPQTQKRQPTLQKTDQTEGILPKGPLFSVMREAPLHFNGGPVVQAKGEHLKAYLAHLETKNQDQTSTTKAPKKGSPKAPKMDMDIPDIAGPQLGGPKVSSGMAPLPDTPDVVDMGIPKIAPPQLGGPKVSSGMAPLPDTPDVVDMGIPKIAPPQLGEPKVSPGVAPLPDTPDVVSVDMSIPKIEPPPLEAKVTESVAPLLYNAPAPVHPLMTSSELRVRVGNPKKKKWYQKSNFDKICKLLDQYHQEKQGRNSLVKRESLLKNIRAVTKTWVAKNEGNKLRKLNALKQLDKQVQIELGNQVIPQLGILKEFDKRTEDEHGNETRTWDLPEIAKDMIPDLNRIWKPEEYEKYVMKAKTRFGKAKSGKTIDAIHGVLGDYYYDSLRPYQETVDQAAGFDEEKLKDVTKKQHYIKLMNDVNKYRARMLKWSAHLETLAMGWLTGHEDDTSRKHRYPAMLKFLAQVKDTRNNFQTKYPALKEFPDLNINNKYADLTKIKNPDEFDQLTGYGKEKLAQEEKLVELSGKYYGQTFDGAFSKLAPAIDLAVPKYRDKSQLKASLAIPVGAGIGVLTLTALLKAENKEKGKLKVRGEFSVGGGVADPTGWLALIAGELGGYFEAQGTNSQNVMQQLSYGLYRRFRESRVIPRSLTSRLWGKGKSASARYRASENWAAKVEDDVLGKTEKPDDVYVDLGFLGRVKGKAAAGSVAEIKAEHQSNTGKRYNKNTIKALSGDLGKKEKYAKLKELGIWDRIKGKGRQKNKGKHYGMHFTEVEGKFSVGNPLAGMGVKVKYKHTREYSGTDDRKKSKSKFKTYESNLVKTKHEVVVTINGFIAAMLQTLVTTLGGNIYKLAERLTRKEQENPDGRTKTQRAGMVLEESTALSHAIANIVTLGNIKGTIGEFAGVGSEVNPTLGWGIDLNHEMKWKNGQKAEKKTEVDLRRVQDVTVKVPGLGSFKSEKRSGLLGTVLKYKLKPVENPKTSKVKTVQENVYKAIEEDVKKRNQPPQSESDDQKQQREKKIKSDIADIVFDPEKLKEYDEKRAKWRPGKKGDWKNTSPSPKW